MHTMKALICLVIAWMPFWGIAQGDMKTPFEKGDGNQSTTYDEAIAFYKNLAETSAQVKMVVHKDATDIGRPMHEIIISGDGMFHPKQIRSKEKLVLFILNGIHPGESCGVDASMMLARDLVTDKMLAPILEHIAIVIVPVYNVGGYLNRSCCTRANQNGPAEQGFRGNARNLDLNRDFIKMDSKNARTFATLFQKWNPDLFLDTHTSNGADYPYKMTYVMTQKDKLYPEMAQYLTETVMPEMTKKMEVETYPLTTYVNPLNWQNPPDSGIAAYLDSPRYSSGYASLFNTMGIMTEAHMLKPYKDRVWGTYFFNLNFLKIINRDRRLVERMREAALKAAPDQEEYVLRWKLDMKHPSKLKFRGYRAEYRQSQVTGKDQLYYNRDESYEKEILYYDTYLPEVTVTKPDAYVIPQGYEGVIERLKLSGVKMQQLSEDVVVDAEMYYIENYETRTSPYEGHYQHYNTTVRSEKQQVQYYRGDYVVFTDQRSNRFIVETLEPEGEDSWFNWNFFDQILMRKEYFSAYVFDKTAEKLLAEHPEWKEELEKAKAEDPALAENTWMQLDFIYRKSEWYEPTHNRYPIARLTGKVKLPLKK